MQKFVYFVKRFVLSFKLYCNFSSSLSVVMEICNGDYGAHIPKLVESIQNGKSNVWRSDKTFYLNKKIITSQQLVPMRLYSFETEFKHTPHYAASSWKQLCVLVKRNAIRLFRDKVIFLFIISSVYYIYSYI